MSHLVLNRWLPRWDTERSFEMLRWTWGQSLRQKSSSEPLPLPLGLWPLEGRVKSFAAKQYFPTNYALTNRVNMETEASKPVLPPHHLLLDMVSFEAARARPLTPAVRAGSIVLLLDCVLSLPHVFGFKLARKEDLGDWVVVGLLAIRRKNNYS